MEQGTKEILEVLRDSQAPVTPSKIAEATGMDKKIVSKTIKSLRSEGLVDSPVRCKYAITDAGRTRLAE